MPPKGRSLVLWTVIVVALLLWQVLKSRSIEAAIGSIALALAAIAIGILVGKLINQGRGSVRIAPSPVRSAVPLPKPMRWFLKTGFMAGLLTGLAISALTIAAVGTDRADATTIVGSAAVSTIGTTIAATIIFTGFGWLAGRQSRATPED